MPGSWRRAWRRRTGWRCLASRPTGSASTTRATTPRTSCFKKIYRNAKLKSLIFLLRFVHFKCKNVLICICCDVDTLTHETLRLRGTQHKLKHIDIELLLFRSARSASPTTTPCGRSPQSCASRPGLLRRRTCQYLLGYIILMLINISFAKFPTVSVSISIGKGHCFTFSSHFAFGIVLNVLHLRDRL